MGQSGTHQRRFTGLSIGLAALVVLVDQLLKAGVTSGSLQFYSDWLELSAHYNDGVMGGVLGDLHPWIVRITFSVLFGFVVMITGLLLHFLKHKEVWRLKYGIVLYVSGILGNVWDRAYSGRITDFINLNLPGLRYYAFNFADLALFAGLVLILVSLIKDHNRIWFESGMRRRLIVERQFQVGFSVFLVFMGGMNALIVALYSFTFFKVYLGGPTGEAIPINLLRDYFVGLGLIEFSFLLITFGTGLLFSHRMVGPVFAFQRFVERILGPDEAAADAKFRVRKMDYFKGLEETAQKISDRLRSRR